MMSVSFIGILVWLPVFVALWLGVIGLAKAGRGGAWWLMLSGVVLLTLGVVGGIAGSILMARMVAASMSHGPHSGGAVSSQAANLVAIGGVIAVGGGFLLFSIGFAIHGFKVRRSRERIEELEMILSAQNEQLSRQQGGSVA